MYFVVEPRTQETQDVARSGTAADFDFVESRLSFFWGGGFWVLSGSLPRGLTLLSTVVPQACSLTELDEKISAVKAALLKKADEFGRAYGPEYPL